MDNRRDHCVHILLLHLGHKAEIDEHELGIGLVVRSHQVARVRVGVKEACLQQLHEEALLTDGNQLTNLARFTLGELAPVNPLGHEHLARRVLIPHLWHAHIGHAVLRQHSRHLLHVRRLIDEVELCVEADSPFVEQRHVIGALLRREARHQSLVHLGGTAQHVEILGDELLHARPLYLDGYQVARCLEPRTVHLRQGGRRRWVFAKLVEDLLDSASELLLDHFACDRRFEPFDSVLKHSELIESRLRQHVGSH
mmetsp:Transcript_76044/g.150674  ORF Transcript_76044/g.150674 Transcript_76044/m.150674 type:complete len:254 (+) Transcript_76044:1573-2334(+)